VAEQAQRMEELKTEWLGILNGLVENINQRFSRFFSILDFAGEVRLTHGAHDNDFENYGLKIFVTYREREPLQVGQDIRYLLSIHQIYNSLVPDDTVLFWFKKTGKKFIRIGIISFLRKNAAVLSA
jgi:hypothetical protein